MLDSRMTRLNDLMTNDMYKTSRKVSIISTIFVIFYFYIYNLLYLLIVYIAWQNDSISYNFQYFKTHAINSTLYTYLYKIFLS